MLRYFYDDITLRISVCGVTVRLRIRSVRPGQYSSLISLYRFLAKHKIEVI